MPYEKIALVKVAWSDNGYQGGLVSGKYSYGKEHSEHVSNGLSFYKGHEAYNFKVYKNQCYGFIPPVVSNKPPNPKEKDEWLVVFFSNNSDDDLYVVGWYESATFSEYKYRPEYQDNKISFPKDAERSKYSYCVTTDSRNVYVPQHPIKCDNKKFKDHLRRQLLYVKGNKSSVDKNICKQIEMYLESNILSKKEFSESKLAKKYIPPETEIKEQIEKNAIKFAKKSFENDGYRVKSVERDNCGWDLTCTKDRAELHVEVKGTSRDEYHFFLSKNELNAMCKSLEGSSDWRLFVVKNVLKKSEGKLVSAKDMNNTFELRPFCIEGTLKKTVKKKVKPLKRKVRKQQ